MNLKGHVTLDGQWIGEFSVEAHDLDITFNKGAADLEETLEFAAENGMTLALAFEYAAADVQMTEDLTPRTPTERKLADYTGFHYSEGTNASE